MCHATQYFFPTASRLLVLLLSGRVGAFSQLPFGANLATEVPTAVDWLETEKQGIGATEGDMGTHLESPEIINLLAEIEVELSDQQPIPITGEAGGPAAVRSCHIAGTIEVAEVVVSFKGAKGSSHEVVHRVGSEEGQAGTWQDTREKAFITTPRSATFQSPSLRLKGPGGGAGGRGGRALLSRQSVILPYP